MQSDSAKQNLLTRLIGDKERFTFARAWQTDCARIALYKAMGWMSAPEPSGSETLEMPPSMSSAELPGNFLAIQASNIFYGESVSQNCAKRLKELIAKQN